MHNLCLIELIILTHIILPLTELGASFFKKKVILKISILTNMD